MPGIETGAEQPYASRANDSGSGGSGELMGSSLSTHSSETAGCAADVGAVEVDGAEQVEWVEETNAREDDGCPDAGASLGAGQCRKL